MPTEFPALQAGGTLLVQLKDPTYEVDGQLVLDPKMLLWSDVPIATTEVCCCNHEGEVCPLENHGTTACTNCVHSWAIDHNVALRF
jgi:hypothetical protein